jgi:glycosyltransferase involved in cell wall biosynthesis
MNTMNTRPLLSVCIATYNRASYLKIALEHLRLQIQDNPEINSDIEIVISDNASEDNSSDVSEEFRKHFVHYTYTRNSENVGFDLNTINVVKHATGKWCWFHGDDDFILRGGLKNILNMIRSDNFGFIGVTSLPIEDGRDYRAEPTIKHIEFVTTNDPTEAYFKNYCQGAFSSLIFLREEWLCEAEDRDYMRYWLYYEPTLRILSSAKKKLAYVSTPLVATAQDCRWTEGGTELYTFGNSCIILDRMQGWGFDKESLAKARIKNSRRLPIILLRAKGNGLTFESKHLQYIWKNLGTAGTPILIIATLIFFTPNVFIRLARNIRHKILGTTPEHRLRKI